MAYLHSFARPTLRQQLLVRAARHFSSSTTVRLPSPFASQPAPPPLPKEEQERFESLQRASTGAFSTPRATISVNQSPGKASAQSEERLRAQDANVVEDKSDNANFVNARVKAEGQGEELHPDIRRGAKPEFEGDVNPVTGEVGGPKNEPLRWGHSGDWSYNGRCTDF